MLLCLSTALTYEIVNHAFCGFRCVFWLLYHDVLNYSPSVQFADQFAFRPTGSTTTAAIIALLHTVINLLSTEPYVIVISLDFSKAFDSVRHSRLLHKFAQLDLPDHIYHWLANFFYNHSYCTIFQDQQSSLLDISASIIQGSVIGPAAYVVTAKDLLPTVPGHSV